jgi:hypothetical protein
VATETPILQPFVATQGYRAITEDETTVTITHAVNPESMKDFEITAAEVFGDGQFLTVTFTKRHPSA